MQQHNRYTSGEYLTQNPTWHVEDSAWKAGKIAHMLERHSIEPSSVCEIGCGAGEVLLELQKLLRHNAQFVGYDISPQAFELSSPKQNSHLKFILGDLFEHEHSRFDLMLCIDVFEHVEDYMGFLRKLNGRADWIIFHIPLNLSAQTVARSRYLTQARMRLGHIHYFTKETAIDTLRDTGFEVIDHFYTGGSIELPGKRLRTRIMAFPRSLAYNVNHDLAVRLLGGYSLLVLTK